jgi:hypothetical protein
MSGEQVSAFKQLYTEVLKNGGDVSKLPSKIANKNIKCFVKESGRYFLVTDAWFYLPCYFTQKAVSDFKGKNSNVLISDLEKNVILITDWTLEMAKVKSEDVFTSYGGIEIKLIVKSFQPVLKEKVELKRYPVNLYRDDEIKNLINSYTHDCMTAAVGKGVKGESLPVIGAKAGAGAGVVSFASGPAFGGWTFKEGKTPTVPMSSILKQEKGASPKKADPTSKAKVIGGAKGAPKSAKKEAVKGLGSKIAKFSPPGKKNNAKKSTAKLISGATPVLPSPGDGRSGAGTTNQQTMKEFKKMVEWISKNKSGKAKKAGGKTPKGPTKAIKK